MNLPLLKPNKEYSCFQSAEHLEGDAHVLFLFYYLLLINESQALKNVAFLHVIRQKTSSKEKAK